MQQQHWIIFAGSTSASDAAVVSANDDDDDSTAVTTHNNAHGTVKDQHRDKQIEEEIISNGEETVKNEIGAAAAVVAAFNDVEDADGGGADDAAVEVFVKESTLTSSSPHSFAVHDKQIGGGNGKTISPSSETPNIGAAREDIPNVPDAASRDGSKRVADHSRVMDDYQISQNTIANNKNIHPDLEENQDLTPTVHPTSTTTGSTPTTATVSSSHNPTTVSTNEENGNEGNKEEMTTTITTTYEQVMYNSLFQSNIMEYDMMKFDPFSFSGAPLGGWGRATRSRLATLPIRLVVENDGSGGIPLMYYGEGVVGGGGELHDEGEDTDSLNEEVDDIVTISGNEGTSDGNKKRPLESRSTSTSPSSSFNTHSKQDAVKGVRQSTGPHFTIHDSTGQKYICRAYFEDELIVRSRIDSVFNPAITIWDDDVERGDITEQEKGVNDRRGDSGGTVEGSVDNVQEITKKPLRKSFHFNIVGADDDAKKSSETIRITVAKLLRKLRMHDAADELLGLDIDLDSEGVVLMMEDTNEGGETMASEIANIIKAAAVGAGMGISLDQDNNGGSTVASSSSSTMPPQLTTDQIIHLVQSLKGTCSQFHDGGWWSYELCHLQQFRQFHVAISNDPSGLPKYEVNDVSLVGKFDGDLNIINPKGIHDGEFVKGSVTSVKYNDMGVVLDVRTSEHDIPDVELYPSEITNFENAVGNRRNGAPVVMHMFQGGDFCDEVGYNRQANNEMYCCTEDFINRWMGAKKQNGVTPRAVVLSVQEVAPCIYNSKICTPILCPKHTPESNASDIETMAAEANVVPPKTTSSSTAQQQQQPGKGDPIDALLSAVFGEDTPELGEIRIYFPDDLTGQEFDELVRQANDGIDFTADPSFQRVKTALRKLPEGGDHDTKAYSKTMTIKDLLLGSDDDDVDTNRVGYKFSSSDKGVGSIREILNKSLGTRMCLEKASGW